MSLRKQDIDRLTITIQDKQVTVMVHQPGPQHMKAYFQAGEKEWDIYSARVALGKELIKDITENHIQYHTENGWKPLTAKVPQWKEIMLQQHFPILAAIGFFFEKQLQPIPQIKQGEQNFFDKSTQHSREP